MAEGLLDVAHQIRETVNVKYFAHGTDTLAVR